MKRFTSVLSWLGVLFSLAFISGCKIEPKVQAVESIWKWPNFLQNLLRNFNWVDKSHTETTIYGADPKVLAYSVIGALLVGAVLATLFWLVVVTVQWLRRRKLKKQFAQLVMQIDFAGDISTVKRLTQYSADRGYQRRVKRYANRDKPAIVRLKKWFVNIFCIP